VRRAAGFTLSNTEYLLRSFATFATDRNQTHIRTATAIDWASLAGSVAQRHTRYQTVCRFAQYLSVEDSRHESPPPNHFGYRKSRRVPHIYSRDEIDGLVLAAMRLPPSESLQPKTYAALISLLAATGLRISEALGLSVDLREAVMACLSGGESRRWTVAELVERFKNLGICASRASVTAALADLGLELEFSS
jgi:integrase/recombinase XerD